MMNSRYPKLSITALARIDDICLAFEQAHQSDGPAPSIDDILTAVEADQRGYLLTELILLEVDYLSRRGEQPDIDAYAKRFPDDAPAVDHAFLIIAESTSRRSEQPVDLGDRYRSIELLGTGGMGKVYRAADTRLGREVAIKVLNASGLSQDELRQRFDREMKSVAALSHPNIVALYDFVEYRDSRFAVMELVKGKTLRVCINEGVSQQMAVEVAMGIAGALGSAHASDIMHRDIKPENVIVSAAGQAKVLDFGLARLESLPPDQSLTATSLTPGTFPYMSPEQADSAALTCATDIFSLGTVLFEMLTGRNPFRGRSAIQTLKKVSDADLPLVSDFPQDTPEGLISLVFSMLQRDPLRRPSARQVEEHLKQLMATVVGSLASGSTYASTADHTSNLFASPVPTNLPLRPAELTGRDQVYDDIAEKLLSHAIVTIIGAGGVGKTSVALEVARRSLKAYPGGVWLCEFAPVRESADVVEVLAGVLDGNAGSITELEEMVRRLYGLPTLLVLDNCEHVIDAAADLAETLSQRLPELSILATSRESLNVAGEYVSRLDGLSYQGPTSDAAALFTARATALAGYQDDDENQELVEQIVTRLEGLPLTIELAAPKLATMSLTELHEALDDQVNTLRGRRSQDRQATVGQAIAWSFDLLDETEQKMLLALSVFATAFTSDAAVAVCGLTSSSKSCLRRLVEQSVVVRREHHGMSRYRLLEPIRQYCQSRVAPDTLAAARERHARYYAARAAILGKGIYGYDEINAANALNIEWPDLRVAVAWGREHEVSAVAIDPIVSLAWAIMMHLRTEAYQWVLEAEKLFGDRINDRADVHWLIGHGYWVLGDFEKSKSYLNRADQIEPTSQSCFARWCVLFSEKRFTEANDAYERSGQIARASGDEHEIRWSSVAIRAGTVSWVDPQDPRVDKDLAECSAFVSKLDWPTGKAWQALAEGVVAVLRQENSSALDCRRRTIEWARSCGNRWIEMIVKLIINDALDPSVLPAAQLDSAVKSLRFLLDTGSVAQRPAAARSIVIALATCKYLQDAAKCSGAAEALTGVGDGNEFTPQYPSVIQGIIDELGQDDFEHLRAEGIDMSPEDIAQLGEDILCSIS